MADAQHWPVFVSYSRADKRIVATIVAIIRAAGVNAFRDEDSIQPGKQWALVIGESIRDCRTVLVFWSVSAAVSEAVAGEYRLGMEHEKDIVPILLDDTVLPEALRAYQWIDFRPVFAVGAEGHDLGDQIAEMDRELIRGLKIGTGVGAVAGGLSGGPFGAIVGAGLGALLGSQATAAWREVSKRRALDLDTVTRAKILSTLRERILK